MKLKGRIEEIKGHVFDLHAHDQAERFNQTIKDTKENLDRELDPLTGKDLHNIKVLIIRNPKNTELSQ